MLLLGASTGTIPKAGSGAGDVCEQLDSFPSLQSPSLSGASDGAKLASSPSATCICFITFHLPSDLLITIFFFRRYLKLHWPYLLLSPRSTRPDRKESPVLAYHPAESVLCGGSAPAPPRDAHPF